MSSFRVETNRLRNHTETIRTYISEIQNAINSMNDEIVALSPKWQGIASSSFMFTYKEDCEKLEEIMTTLTYYCEQLKKAQGEYNRCEKNVESKIRSI